MPEQVYKGSKTLMPICVATYLRGDRECDGDASGETDHERMACVFRDRCVAMGIHGRSHRLDRSQLVQVVRARGGDGRIADYCVSAGDDDELQGIATELIHKCGIRDGVAAHAPLVTQQGIRPATAVVNTAVRTAKAHPRPTGPSRGKLVPNVAGRLVVAEIGDHYQQNVLSRLGRDIATSMGEALPGQFFLLDRRDKSGYAAMYIKTIHESPTKHIAVTSMYFRPGNGRLEVRIAIPYMEFVQFLSAPNKLRLQPEDYTGKDGRFCVRFHKLDKVGAGLVAEALDRAVKAGILILPPVLS